MTLVYRPYFKGLYFFVSLFSLFCFLSFSYFLMAKVFDLAIVFLIFFTFNFFIAKATLKSHSHKKIHFEKGVINISTPSEKKIYLISEITKVILTKKNFSLFFLDGKSLRFSTALVGSEQLLDEIYKLKPEIISSVDLQNYRKNSILVQHSWDRLKETSAKSTPIAIKYFFYPLLGQMFFQGFDAFSIRGLIPFLMNFLLCSLLGALLYGARELLIYHHDWNLQGLNRHFSYEKKIHNISQVTYYLLTLSVYLLLRLQMVGT